MFVNVRNQLHILLSQDNIGQAYESRDFKDFILSSKEDKDCIDPSYDDLFSTPNSNSFLDLNGDCMPDIFMQRSRKNKDN